MNTKANSETLSETRKNAASANRSIPGIPQNSKMLSGIANYLFGATDEAENQVKELEPRLQTRYAENCDWIIVEQSSSEYLWIFFVLGCAVEIMKTCWCGRRCCQAVRLLDLENVAPLQERADHVTTRPLRLSVLISFLFFLLYAFNVKGTTLNF